MINFISQYIPPLSRSTTYKYILGVKWGEKTILPETIRIKYGIYMYARMITNCWSI